MPDTAVARPAVTVCIPAYRPGPRFVGLLESLARQTYPNVVIRVSLDHAPDHTLPALPDMRGRRLEFIRQSQQLGWVGNTNAVLEAVDTPYFILVMHDDQLTPGYLAAAVDVLERRPEVAVAHGAVRHHGVRDGETHGTDSMPGTRMQRIRTFLAREPHNSGFAWRGVIRSSLITHGLRLRAHRSDGMFSNDLFGLEVLVHGESVALPGIYYDKFTDPEGLSRKFHGRSVEQRSEMLADNLACLLDVLIENRFSDQERMEILSGYAEWLMRLQGNWNVIADKPRSDDATFAEVRPAIARFLANALMSAGAAAAESRPTETAALTDVGAPLGATATSPDAVFVPAQTTTRRPRMRTRVKLGLRRVLVRLPHIVRGNPLFDATQYLARYPDVAAKHKSAYRHYWRHGIREGHDPNELFDTDWYLARYDDVASSGMDPLDHYLVFGAAEGRDPGPRFDTDWYLRQYPDVAARGLNPLEHYLRYGRRERRLPRDPVSRVEPR